MIVAKDSDSEQMMDTDGPDIFYPVGGLWWVNIPYFFFEIIILVVLFSLPRGTVINKSIACELVL